MTCQREAQGTDETFPRFGQVSITCPTSCSRDWPTNHRIYMEHTVYNHNHNWHCSHPHASSATDLWDPVYPNTCRLDLDLQDNKLTSRRHAIVMIMYYDNNDFMTKPNVPIGAVTVPKCSMVWHGFQVFRIDQWIFTSFFKILCCLLLVSITFRYSQFSKFSRSLTRCDILHAVHIFCKDNYHAYVHN